MQTCNGTRVRLVAGNTGVGIFKDVESYKCFVKIRDLQELKAVEVGLFLKDFYCKKWIHEYSNVGINVNHKFI